MSLDQKTLNFENGLDWLWYPYHEKQVLLKNLEIFRVEELETYFKSRKISVEPLINLENFPKWVSKFLTSSEPVRKNYLKLSPWEKLKVLELLVGTEVSTSKLFFQQIT